MRDKQALGSSADVFSLGRLFFMIMTGRHPLMGVGRREIVEAAENGECPALDWPEDMPLLQVTRELCDACLHPHPADRISTQLVQSRLHGWALNPDLPEGIPQALRQALPRWQTSGIGGSSGSGSGSDLQASLQRARDATRRGKIGRCNQAQQLRHQSGGRGAGSRGLLLPALQETPDSTKIRCIAMALCTWNVPIGDEACCWKHATQKELQRVLNKLQAAQCRAFHHSNMGEMRQCPKCKALITFNKSENVGIDAVVECDVCGHEGCDWEMQRYSESVFRRLALPEVVLEEDQEEAQEKHEVGVGTCLSNGHVAATPIVEETHMGRQSRIAL